MVGPVLGAAMAKDFPGDGVGIQVPVGRIAANRTHWQTVLHTRDKPCLYRLHNSRPAGRGQPGNVIPGNIMIVEVDGSKQPLHVAPGSSADVQAKRIRVKAGTGGGATVTVDGWYVLVS
jgi:hypothetical protein